MKEIEVAYPEIAKARAGLIISNELTKDAMFSAAANSFMQIFECTLHYKEYFDVALSGGSTAKEFFCVLVKRIHGHKNLGQIRFFFSDERVVRLESEDSNAGNALRLLFNPLSISCRQFFPMYDEKNSAQVCALIYENLLRKHLHINSQGLPRFDLLYLGIGIDGHIASLFPHSPLVDMITSHRSYVNVAYTQGVAHERITLMPIVINAAKHLHAMAMGSEKVPVIQNILNGPYVPSLLPAQLVLKQAASQVVLFLAEMGELPHLQLG
jgi:6-phosphogluconolactonase